VTFEDIVRQEARLIILRTLNEQPDSRLNSELLREHLELYGINKSRDWLHEELRWLADLGTLSITDVATVKIASLTGKGRDHAERRIVIEGIKRPSPRP
jgi:hypothetical protein